MLGVSDSAREKNYEFLLGTNIACAKNSPSPDSSLSRAKRKHANASKNWKWTGLEKENRKKRLRSEKRTQSIQCVVAQKVMTVFSNYCFCFLILHFNSVFVLFLKLICNMNVHIYNAYNSKDLGQINREINTNLGDEFGIHIISFYTQSVKGLKMTLDWVKCKESKNCNFYV